METKKQIQEIIIYEIIIVLLAGIFLKNFINVIKFSAAFIFLYFIPLLPWIIKLKINILEKMVLINTLGLALVPTLFIFAASVTKLTTAIYVTIPIIVFILGIYKLKKDNKLLNKE